MYVATKCRYFFGAERRVVQNRKVLLSASKLFESMNNFKTFNDLKLCRINDTLRLAVNVKMSDRENESSISFTGCQ